MITKICLFQLYLNANNYVIVEHLNSLRNNYLLKTTVSFQLDFFKTSYKTREGRTILSYIIIVGRYSKYAGFLPEHDAAVIFTVEQRLR